MGKKMTDLTGQRFGKWTVKGFDKIKGSSYLWKCVCDCGTEKSVDRSSLKSGYSKNCGCWKIKTDISGLRFGRLIAIKSIDKKDSAGSLYWECQCDCGKTKNVSRRHLVNGGTKSCGCLIENIVGNIPFFDGTSIGSIRSKKIFSNNTSGVRGVSWRRKQKRWRACIKFKSKNYELGSYENISDAAAIRKRAEEKIFGEFLEWYDSRFPKKIKKGEVNNEILLRSRHQG